MYEKIFGPLFLFIFSALLFHIFQLFMSLARDDILYKRDCAISILDENIKPLSEFLSKNVCDLMEEKGVLRFHANDAHGLHYISPLVSLLTIINVKKFQKFCFIYKMLTLELSNLKLEVKATDFWKLSDINANYFFLKICSFRAQFMSDNIFTNNLCISVCSMPNIY